MDKEIALFLKQALSGLVIKESDFLTEWSAIHNLLEHAVREDGRRMFHWVNLRIATVVVCPVTGSGPVEVGRFYRVGGDASVAETRHFTLYR